MLPVLEPGPPRWEVSVIYPLLEAAKLDQINMAIRTKLIVPVVTEI
jgi:hypothetical protein